ncbi:MAG: helix-turn-helix domain-containing protein [Sporolactobacillus sp.]
MDIDQLQKIFPELKISRTPFVPDSNSFYFHQGLYYVAVPTDNMSARDRQLFTCFVHPEALPQYAANAQIWYDVLVNGKDPDRSLLGRNVQFILFHLDKGLDQDVRGDWRSTLEAFFDESAAFLYLNASEGAIIERQATRDASELEAIANTLTNDFAVACHFQIGLRYRVTTRIQQIFAEQKRLFSDECQSRHTVSTVEASLVQILRPQLKESQLIREVKALLQEDNHWAALIRALWDQQGNISLAAKHLYMHRNTLQYRMEKFYEWTGISLREMDGLVLVYLSL